MSSWPCTFGVVPTANRSAPPPPAPIHPLLLCAISKKNTKTDPYSAKPNEFIDFEELHKFHRLIRLVASDEANQRRPATDADAAAAAAAAAAVAQKWRERSAAVRKTLNGFKTGRDGHEEKKKVVWGRYYDVVERGWNRPPIRYEASAILDTVLPVDEPPQSCTLVSSLTLFFICLCLLIWRCSARLGWRPFFVFGSA